MGDRKRMPHERQGVQGGRRTGGPGDADPLATKGAPWHPKVCANAARSGNIDALEWARDNGAPWDGAAVVLGAVKEGSLPMLSGLVEAGVAAIPDAACCVAARAGNLEVLKWLSDRGARVDREACLESVEVAVHDLSFCEAIYVAVGRAPSGGVLDGVGRQRQRYRGDKGVAIGA